MKLVIEITDKRKCTGCACCVNVCPNDAIIMENDGEGFSYPSVDKSLCISCSLCEKKCPLLNSEITERQLENKPIFYSAQLKDKNELSTISSGGAAWALAEYVLNNDGIVYGAAIYNGDQVKHIRVTSIEEAQAIKKSKYFQSDIGYSYKRVKGDLEQGKLVLFTGVGCQIAGLNSYLGKTYDNLITADVICHGVPSSKVWKAFKEETEIQRKAEIVDLNFRDKSRGWQNNHYKTTFKNGDVEYQPSVEHPFHRGYLLGLYSRPSCGACTFNLLPRVSDFTFADYWQYDGIKFTENLNKGVSLIAINTKKASSVLKQLDVYMEIENTSYDNALHSARHMNNTPLESDNRARFFEVLEKKGFYHAWDKYIKEKKENILKKVLRRVILGK